MGEDHNGKRIKERNLIRIGANKSRTIHNIDQNQNQKPIFIAGNSTVIHLWCGWIYL